MWFENWYNEEVGGLEKEVNNNISSKNLSKVNIIIEFSDSYYCYYNNEEKFVIDENLQDFDY